MSISQSAACNVVPFLARIVLAAAFVTAGWNKISTETTFSGDEAATLRSLGVTGRPVTVSAASHTGIQLASFTFEAATPPTAPPPTAPPSATPPPSAPPKTDVPAKAPPSTPAATGPSAPPSAPRSLPPTGLPPTGLPPIGLPPIGLPPTGLPPNGPPTGETKPSNAATDSAVPARPTPVYEPDAFSSGTASGTALGDPTPLMARSLHRITLMVHAQGWSEPVYQAYAAVFVELVGGALLLLGLFSRLWGLGLAVTMAVAFLLTSWPTLQNTSLFALSVADFNKLYCQTGLFVLAFGVMLTGAGALSLDRMIFRPSAPEGDVPA